MSNYTHAAFNATSEYHKLQNWVLNVAVATLVCIGFAFSLVCYLVWLAKPAEGALSSEDPIERTRSRSNSSDGGFGGFGGINPIFAPTRKVILNGVAGSGKTSGRLGLG